MRFMAFFLRNQSGAALSEYSLAAVVVAGIVSASSSVMSAQLHSVFAGTGGLLANLVY